MTEKFIFRSDIKVSIEKLVMVAVLSFDRITCESTDLRPLYQQFTAEPRNGTDFTRFGRAISGDSAKNSAKHLHEAYLIHNLDFAM